jgi:hypothetical protein
VRFKVAKAVAFAVIIWLVGFVWGSIVFMTPALKQTPRIPYISSNPAISFPILLIWAVLTYVLARSFLKRSADTENDGLKLGITFVVVNLFLDLVVLVSLLKAGFGYFLSLTVWTAYAMLVLVPWLTGRSVEKMR